MTDMITDRRNQIARLVDFIRPMDQVECPVTHRFSPGLYLREILIPKGTLIIGKIHATEHFNIILQGEVTVVTALEKKRLKAPCTFTSKAGEQKVVYAHSDCIWQTTHVTEETDLARIEEEVIVESYDQLEVDGLLAKLEEDAA